MKRRPSGKQDEWRKNSPVINHFHASVKMAAFYGGILLNGLRMHASVLPNALLYLRRISPNSPSNPKTIK